MAIFPEPVAIPSWSSPHGRTLPRPGKRTLVMGMVSGPADGTAREAAKLVAEGADLLEISPGATDESAADELARVQRAVATIRSAFPQVPLSIETSRSEVARAAVASGADIISDTWGGAFGISSEERRLWIEAGRERRPLPTLSRSEIAAAATDLKCPLILRHNRPNPNYGAFLEDVLLDLRLSLVLAHDAGTPKHQLWLDPGLGSAKSSAQDLELLKRLRSVVELGYPVTLRPPRESTVSAAAVWAIQQGAAMLRVRDLRYNLPSVRTADAIRAGLAWQE